MNTPADRPTALILGANGRFGAAAVTAFTAAGWQVLAQARRPSGPLPAGARHLPQSLDDLDGLAQAARGAGVVVHAINPVYTRWTQEALPLARAGMDLAQRLGAVLMLPGNVYNFGSGMPALLHEDTPERPDTRKGRLRVEMEAELAERGTRGALRSVVIRAGDFYGAGSGSWLDLVIAKSLRGGKLAYPGPLDRAHAWAYLPDLAATFAAVAQHPAELPAHTRLHFAGHTLSGEQMLAAVAQAAGELGLTPARGWQRGGMPWGLIRLMGLVWPMGRELAEMAYLWTVPHALDGSALQARLGNLPSTPVDLAMRRALQDLGFGAQPTRTTAAA